MGNASGASLGEARGTLGMDVAPMLRELARAVQVAGVAGKQIEQALGGIDKGTKRAEKSIGGLGASLKGLAGTFGVGLGIAGALRLAQTTVELAKASAEAERTRGAFDRLAAGIGESGEKMLASMQKASDGLVADARLIQIANSALLLKAADTNTEMSALLEIATARAAASGRSMEDVFNRLALGIGKREPELLDEIGIVLRLPPAYEKYAAELGTTAERLTEAQKTQALYNEVMRQSEGLLKDNANQVDNNAKKFERAQSASQNARIALGNLFADDIARAAQTYANIVQGIADNLDRIAAGRRNSEAAGGSVRAIQEQIAMLESGGGGSPFLEAGMAADQRRSGTSVQQQIFALRAQLALAQGGANASHAIFSPSAINRGAAPTGFDPAQLAEQRAAKLDFEQETQEIERSAQEQRLDATRSYESQRTETIASYERTIAREAEDFGRQRARAQAQFQKQVAELSEGAAKREADMAEDLADRIADLQSGTSDRIAEAQEDTNKRIGEIEEDYRKNRERAERDHRDNLMDAAARLDATAVFNEQKRFARESADAKDAHDEAISDAQEGLQERLEQEAENLAERIAQEQEAHAERLADAREADAERLADMQTDFAEQQRLEDEDREIRLRRMGEDHQAQLDAMDAAQADRIAQINEHEADELKAAEDAHIKGMAEMGVILNEAALAVLNALEKAAMDNYEKWLKQLDATSKFFGPMKQEPAAKNQWPNLADPSSWVNTTPPDPRGGGGDTRIFTVAPGAITVVAATGQSPSMIANEVHRQMIEIFRELGN